MDKDKTAAASFLVMIFVFSFLSHLLYVKGYAFALNAKKLELQERLLTGPFDDQIDCEVLSKTHCVYMVCDIPEGKTAEEICGLEYQKGWYPVFENSK